MPFIHTSKIFFSIARLKAVLFFLYVGVAVFIGITYALFSAMPAHAGILQKELQYDLLNETSNAIGADIVAEDDKGNYKITGVIDPRVFVARLTGTALSLTGVLFLFYSVWAGFKYMTAGGEAERVEKALGSIRNGVIGLIIVFLSFAITAFVFGSILRTSSRNSSNEPLYKGGTPAGFQEGVRGAVDAGGGVITGGLTTGIRYMNPFLWF